MNPRSMACLQMAAALWLIAGAGDAAAATGAPATLEEARGTLDGLAPADLRADSPRLDQAMNRLFPAVGEDFPCVAPGHWISSVALCEWHVPDTPHDALPDMLVSLSEEGLDSAVLWGDVPLNRAAWQCDVVEGRRQATVCMALSLNEERRKTLLREWRTTLAKITQVGEATRAAQDHQGDLP